MCNVRRQGLERRIACASMMWVACMLSACGGGGGGDSSGGTSTTTTSTIQSVTGLNDFSAPPSIASNYRPATTVPPELLQTANASLPTSSEAGYLKVWIVDPTTSQAQVLLLTQWVFGMTVPEFQVPRAVSTVYFEIYNDAGSVQGEWSPS